MGRVTFLPAFVIYACKIRRCSVLAFHNIPTARMCRKIHLVRLLLHFVEPWAVFAAVKTRVRVCMVHAVQDFVAFFFPAIFGCKMFSRNSTMFSFFVFLIVSTSIRNLICLSAVDRPYCVGTGNLSILRGYP